MKLSNIFAQLTSGEMQRHSIGEDLVNGSISPEHYALVLPMVNLGILTLFTRFNVKQDQVIIQLNERITRYTLHPRHSMRNTDNTVDRYIDDTEMYPFVKDTLIKILSVHNELGQERFLNTDNNQWTVTTPAYNVIQHPYPEKENAISVIYQSSLPAIPIPRADEAELFDPAEIELDLPPMFLEPLLYFVGARVHIGLNDQETFNEANNFTSKYERAIAELRGGQMIQTEHDINTKLEMNGWR